MHFDVDKLRLQKMITITRDDHRPMRNEEDEPYYRIEARSDSVLKLSGHKTEAEFPATVHEPGVLFLRVTLFRKMLREMKGLKKITILVNEDGLFFDNVRFPLAFGNMLFYPDPKQAPDRHPKEVERYKEEHEQAKEELRQRIADLEEELARLEDGRPRERGLFE